MARSKTRAKPVISERKRPTQDRSTRLVADILEAAVRVLGREGAQRFTTARVAEEAGVSVGSLYQYFPNKQAILFRLQADEWHQTRKLLDGILNDATRPPLERLKRSILAFFRSECDEARVRVALEDAAPLYREADESREHRKAGMRQMAHFLEEALPAASAKTRDAAADLLTTVISSVGKKISEQARARAEVDALATAVGEMICAYLRTV